MSDNSNLITDFIHCWGEKDIDKMLDYFTHDAVYINIPIDPPNNGKAEIRDFIGGFIESMESMDFVILHQAETAGGVVLNERVDRFLVDGKWLELQVMGIFELKNGKIAKWRDYFDMGQFSSQLPEKLP